MSRRLAAALAAVLFLIPCCDSDAPTGPPDGDGPPLPQSLPLESPAALASRVPPQNPFLYPGGRYLHGAYALEQFGGQRVTASLHRAVFAPATPAGSTPVPAEAAFAICGFDLTGYAGDSTVTLAWQGDPPAAGKLFVGAGNLAQDRWDWFAPPASGPVQLPDLAPYRSAHPHLLLAIAVVGDQPATLEGVQLGERWLVRTVDMSVLCAPVMRFESVQLEADWATRNPVASEFQQVGEYADGDGTRRIVVAHRVDGYRHYGGVVIPPVEDFEKLPVIVLCHPGVGGVTLNSEYWLFNLVQEAGLRPRFLLVIPSFRGEQLSAGPLGSFYSGGRLSVFDRDADDAIALLDCVLQNFPNADASRVLAAGYSRGGQVAMRIAQRDRRIRGVLDFCGMSDEWTLNGQGYMQEFMDGKYPEPEPWDFYFHCLWEYKHGLRTVWETRLVLLRSCIVYQASWLPKLQIHHGVEDVAVPIHEGDRLAAVLATIPAADFEYYRYPTGNHSLPTMIGAGPRVEAFLRSFLPAAPGTEAALQARAAGSSPLVAPISPGGSSRGLHTPGRRSLR